MTLVRLRLLTLCWCETQVTTAQCGVFDPCSDRMATNRTLTTILNALGNLALV